MSNINSLSFITAGLFLFCCFLLFFLRDCVVSFLRVHLWTGLPWESCHLRTFQTKSQKVSSQSVTHTHTNTFCVFWSMFYSSLHQCSSPVPLPASGGSQRDDPGSDHGVWLLLQWERLQGHVHLVQGRCCRTPVMLAGRQGERDHQFRFSQIWEIVVRQQTSCTERHKVEGSQWVCCSAGRKYDVT